MKNKLLSAESILSLLLIALTLLFCNPLQQLWMPTMLVSGIVLCFVVVFILFAAFIWKEKAQDEREEKHRLAAGRAGFLVGAALLVAGIIYQTLNHTLDAWLLVTLTSMVLAKLATIVYSQTHN